ncbi:hypothetical protein BU26DRAFT_589320 [Trematosphaeria pertusa]|uniref:Uncharacterized protein n=1 Tax=Trematosphaeria pertusa TaxID=390896 RepID=A0A6A6IVK9_9PLEO|nr:uncharacterized protein BU26DRAFT_589320 [Trematosphaeria pertusa]KAF2254117.1 hypothetical protein BU26DRAFT_589320 [Trematosphaeria pertusa]
MPRVKRQHSQSVADETPAKKSRTQLHPASCTPPKAFKPADPPDTKIDYSKAPKGLPVASFSYPIYKGVTYNPVIPLAIIRVAEKNLPSINFISALNHLPNLAPTDPYPELPTDDVDFLEDDTHHTRQLMDQPIRILFLPHYYNDGRHAIGFYTRKVPSRRLGSVLFTPCTDECLLEYRLLQRVSEGEEWEDCDFCVSGGSWVHNDVVEEYAEWKKLFMVVAKEWDIVFRLTTREIDEDHPKAIWRAAVRNTD